MKVGSPRSPNIVVVAIPYQAGELMTCRRNRHTKIILRDRHTKITMVVHSGTEHKAATLFSLALSGLSLALTVSNKVYAN